MFDTNNLFATYENIDQKLPVFDEDIFNQYSNQNLMIPEYKTSFIPSNAKKSETDNAIIPTKVYKTNDQQKEKTLKPDGDVRKYVKNWLIQNEGLTNEQASALTGVFYAESNLKPGIHEIGKENNEYAGKGIAQWTGKSRQKHVEDIYKQTYGKSKSIKNMSLDEQLTIAVKEFKERIGNWNKFLQAKDLKTATDIVWRGYENGGNNMLASMQQMQNTYKGNTQRQWNERFRLANEILNI